VSSRIDVTTGEMKFSGGSPDPSVSKQRSKLWKNIAGPLTEKSCISTCLRPLFRIESLIGLTGLNQERKNADPIVTRF
jgi:hypothetical protein